MTKSLQTFFTDLLYPRFCIGCGYVGSYICLSCEKDLPYSTRDICLYCKKATAYGFTHATCLRRDGVDGFITILYYNNFVKKIIKTIKYRLAREVLKEFLPLIKVDAWSKVAIYVKFFPNLYIAPVPLHKNRLKKRGFNQAELLVEFIHRLIPSHKLICLQRSHNTPPQASLKHDLERYRNIQSAFNVIHKQTVVGKTIMLVDDVVTTGSTVREAARALKKAGAKKVLVFALAKG